MKTNYKNLLGVIAFLLAFTTATFAQCPNNNSPYGNISNLNPGQSGTVFCMYGGEYATVSVVSGSQYTFSTCGGSWDSQLTLYSAGGTYLAYNDDACGLQSELTWTATFTGQVHVMLDRYFCNSFFSCMNLTVTRSAPAISPCLSTQTLSCQTSSSYNLVSGTGQWNPPGPWGTPGNEQVFEFTPTNSGSHVINISNFGSGWVDLFIKTGVCNQNGWTYVDDILTSSSNTIVLNAGTTYYFLIDDENTSASSGTISIDCPTPQVDPCSTVTTMACDVPSSYSLGAGNGLWNPTGPWGTPGQEQVFEYTAAVSGQHDVSVLHSGGYYVDLFYGTSCGPNSWTYVDDILSSSTNSIFLNAGTTYYFLIDDENISASNGSITISCPCQGNAIDESVALSGNMVLFNNTSGACDDCSLRPSEDITYEIQIPCAGTYTFETCDLASWDTYLYLSSAPCSGILAQNDDNCGLRSSITYTFNGAGTYYLTVEGFSSSSAGTFGVTIERNCDLMIHTSESQYACGYNISCNGLSDGSVAVAASNNCGSLSYQWSNGGTGASINNVGAGTYSVVVSDEWGCDAHANITLTEPDELEVDAGSDEVVYYGYTPLSCADLSATASGGCAGYDYDWSANGTSTSTGASTTVCPSVTTDYIMTVTDQNGCSGSDDVTVCVIDVTCYAGNSGIQKVEMCHVPPGNSGNAHTICIDEDAVPAHLAHGCTLGSCEEVNACAQTARMAQNNTPEARLKHLSVAPNPFRSEVVVSFDTPVEYYVIELLDLNGKLIERIESDGSLEGSREFTFNLEHLSPGAYIIRSNMDGSIESTKLLKE